MRAGAESTGNRRLSDAPRGCQTVMWASAQSHQNSDGAPVRVWHPHIPPQICFLAIPRMHLSLSLHILYIFFTRSLRPQHTYKALPYSPINRAPSHTPPSPPPQRMPPRPWEQQLTGSSTSHQRRAEGNGASTFSDFEYHHQKRSGHAGAAAGASYSRQSHAQRRGTAASPQRWSFILQDIPGIVHGVLNDVNKGYLTRVAAVVATTFGVSYAVYKFVLQPAQQRRPLAKRWSWCAPPVPITLVEKNREAGSQMLVYRFALPNSYDYAGYAPVSSVRMISGNVRKLSSLSRWYTPISHPDERGFIEFAIKDCDPGRMSARLRYLEPGDVVYLGRWMQEFPYQPNTLKELGLVCTTSGASVALQLMNIIDKNKADDTKLSLLYCHHTATNIPFKDTFFKQYAERNKNRIQVSYNVLAGGRRRESATPMEQNMYVGNIDPETIAAALPPPIRVVEAGAGVGSDTASQVEAYRPQLLICGPQSMLAFFVWPRQLHWKLWLLAGALLPLLRLSQRHGLHPLSSV
ncbi:NADH-cytochrome b5 reductase-like protein [Leishmania tarentolae]|uniref:NADH-cytochrome b5 reductase-like protein n=1 Tax=Leishmania tarentolae TaxID=5689 RepID=A0A640KW76_LEITA|nr:NADH-cytochrome b5 reductase-like protein [Leishmania tarentolae]